MAVIKDISYEGKKSVGSLGGNVRLDEAKGQFVAFNGLNNLGVFGFDSTGEVVLKVAKPGHDADTAADADLIFNSQQNVFKIVKTGSINLTQATIANPGAGNYGSDNGSLGSYTHSLGYIPAVIAYLEFTTGTRVPLPYHGLNTGSSSAAVWQTYYTVVSANVLSINYRSLVYGMGALTFLPPVAVKFYLMQESAS